MKKKIWISIALLAVIVIVIISYTAGSHDKDSNVITVGSVTSDADIWRHLSKSEEAKKLKLNIEVKEFTDGLTLNKATAEGQVDINAFQSYGYFKAFNKESKDGKLTSLGTTYLEPLGIYSEKYKNIKDIPSGATIAIAKDLADESRGLKLLADAGLISLDDSFGALDGLEKIKSNPHHFKFKEIDDTTGGRLLHDNGIDAVLISNSVSQAAGLNVLQDSIYHEHINNHTRENINIIVTAAKNKNNESYKKLVTLYHAKASQRYIAKKYHGTKTEVDKPLSYFEGDK